MEGVLGNVGKLIEEAESQLEVVVYNGARVGPSVLLEWGVEGLEEDLRVSFVVLIFFLFSFFLLFFLGEGLWW